MEHKSLVCPHCGANTTNLKNCEYCGSLFVRFVDQGIDISDTSYLSEGCKFPELENHLRRNLQMQLGNPEESVVTDIFWKTTWKNNAMSESISVLRSGYAGWHDDTQIRLGNLDAGLIIVLSFDNYVNEWTEARKRFNQDENERLAKFKQLRSFPLFDSHSTTTGFDSKTTREYAIDFGKDAEGAAKLISEILTEVYDLKPTDNYDIFTNVGVENTEKARNEWFRANGMGPLLEPKDYIIMIVGAYLLLRLLIWLDI